MRRIVLACLAWCAWLSVASAQSPPAVPESLEPWRDWVLHGHEHRRCPLLFGHDPAAADAHACAWPGPIALQADDDGGRFGIEWTVLVESAIALPGDRRLRPLGVQVDGRDAAVVMLGEQPTVRLAPGRHRIDGRFVWADRPQRLPLPAAIGLIVLQVDGQPVAVPQRDDQHLWLGSSRVEPVGSDSLSLRVYRLLADGVPPMLSTELQLEVSGRARELELARPLPDGFIATALDSPLPATIDADGRLRLQLRPGSWRVHLHARALTVADRYVAASAEAPWPAEEIWSFRAAPVLRSVQADSARPVDPQQVAVPWGDALPSFVLAGEIALTLQPRSRGLDPERPHRLQLDRTLWLDFTDGGLTALDRVSGQLAAPGRLDLLPPWQLEQAQADGDPLLLTASIDEATGIELRERNVDLTALSRRADLSEALGTGWNTAFDAVSMALQLPPGWRLLHAGGADRAPDAYTARWTLLDLFLLALATLLGYRLGGLALAAIVAGYLLLGYHEADPPLWTLLGAMLAALFARMLPVGRLARVVGAVRTLLLLLAVLWALPFAATQLKLALYPQLECAEVGIGYDGGCDTEAIAQVTLDAVTVSGSRLKQADMVMEEAAPMSIAAPPPAPPAPPAPMPPKRVSMPSEPLDRYPSDAVVQAGPGVPDWQWRRVGIDIDGPVTPQQKVSLWLAPPWLGSLWRLAVVLLLAVLIVRLTRGAFRLNPTGTGKAGAGAAIALLATLAVVPPADAAEFPSEPLLEQLRERLLEPPRCGTQCAGVERATVQLDGDRLRLQLELHGQAESAVPLPAIGRGAALLRVRLDGADASALRRNDAPWLRLPRGVHLAELEWQLAGIDTLDLRFPLPPATVLVDARGWDPAGLQDGRLLGDTLQLLRQAPAAVDGSTDPAAGVEFAPFVRLTRHIELGLDWSVTTTAERIAPQHAGFTLQVPLIDGERVLDDALPVADGQLQLAFAAGQSVQSWRSQLPIAPAIALHAGPLSRISERWQVQVGPYWHLEHAGVPEIDGHGGAALQFQPLPDETLQLAITRPTATDGASVAIDAAMLVWQPGERVADATLDLDLRSTRGGPHALTLPADAELVEVRRDGQSMPLRLVERRLTLPLLPGEQHWSIRWRQSRDGMLWLRSPDITLDAPAANLQIDLQMPERRWLLATFGDGIGPAVLYWPLLLLVALLAWGLARLAPTPLRFRHWLLLGLGFSTVSWIAGAVVAGWLLLLGLRRRDAIRLSQWPRIGFALAQIGLVLVTLLALLCLVAAIPYGLLGDPAMQVVGNGSDADQLHWFVDRSAGALPQVAVLSLPSWLYQLALLAWALWLANALIGWLRWGWQCFAAGGYWPPRRPTPPATDAAPPTDG